VVIFNNCIIIISLNIIIDIIIIIAIINMITITTMCLTCAVSLRGNSKDKGEPTCKGSG
jgi:hypothetical protein